MRWLRYIMVTIALAGAVGAYLYHRAAANREFLMVDSTRNALIDLGQKVRYLKATERIEVNEFGWPDVLDPQWFEDAPPRNSMLDGRHPWLEVASTLEYALDHPVQRVAINGRLAGFWYNPAKGIIRARVPQTVSDEKTIELYNRVNGASISELFDSSPKRRILEDLLNDDEEVETDELEPQTGVTVRRAADEAQDDTGDPDAPDDGDAPPDDGAPEDDGASGPVPVDEPPASDGDPVDDASDDPRGADAPSEPGAGASG